MSKKKKALKQVDEALDTVAVRTFHYGSTYQWWWNGDSVLALAIASVVRHLRRDGATAYSDAELEQLRKMERWFSAHGMSDTGIAYGTIEAEWLYAEAMFLFGEWFSRLWD